MREINTFFLIISLLILASCQKEEYEVLSDQDQNTITLNSESYNLVFRSSMHDGSEDDEIDNSPCYSIDFPYTINIGGAEVTITSEADRNSFLADLPANTPLNAGNLNFPLTLVNAAHQRVQVMNRQQLAGLQQACRNSINERGGPITCVQLVFPVQVFSYERGSQETGSTILNNQEELYTYLINLTPNTVMSFEFPLEVRRNNRNIAVPNQSRLVDLLEECAE